MLVHAFLGFGRRTRITAAFALVALGVPAMAAAPGLAMLDGLERGQWVLNDRDHDADRILCVTDWRQALQIHQPRATCSRFVLDDEAAMVRVHYSCGASGSGQTTVRRETGHLVQIDTQGIDDGTPFSNSYEARFTGACDAGGASPPRHERFDSTPRHPGLDPGSR